MSDMNEELPEIRTNHLRFVRFTHMTDIRRIDGNVRVDYCHRQMTDLDCNQYNAGYVAGLKMGEKDGEIKLANRILGNLGLRNV
jgi:hypothetical protein